MKRRAVGHPAGGNENFNTVYVSDIPVGYEEEDVRQMYEEIDGTDPSDLVEVRFLPRKYQGETFCAMLEFVDAYYVDLAVSQLDGKPLETASGTIRYLGVRPAGEPSAKKQRTDTNHTKVVASDTRSKVYLTDLPIEYTEQSFRTFHGRDLRLAGLEEIKFLPQKLKKTQRTCAVMLSYKDHRAAMVAIGKLDGHSFANSDRSLGAKLADPKGDDGPRNIAALESRYPPKGYGMMPHEAASSMPSHSPSLYVSDLPAQWTDDDIWSLHAQLRLNPQKLLEIKHLKQKVAGDCGSAIFKYADTGAASRALQQLHGYPIVLRKGVQKYIGARWAGEPKGSSYGDGLAMRPSPKSSPSGNASQSRFSSGYARQISKAAGNGIPRREDTNNSDDVFNSLPSVYVSDIPWQMDEKACFDLHSELGIEYLDLKAVRFLPRKLDGKTKSAFFKYATVEDAETAIEAVKGYEVIVDGGKKFLGARLADSIRKQDGQDETALYVSDFPLDYDAESMENLHRELGADATAIMSVSFLPPKLNSGSCAAIIHYNTADAAQEASDKLTGHIMDIEGKKRELRAKPATQHGKDKSRRR